MYFLKNVFFFVLSVPLQYEKALRNNSQKPTYSTNKKKIAWVEILGSKKITCPGKAGMYGSLMLVLS